MILSSKSRAASVGYDPRLFTRVISCAWLPVALGLTLAAWLAHAERVTGLTLAIQSGADLNRSSPLRRVPTLDTRDLWADAGRGPVRASWHGFWYVATAGEYQIEARSDDTVSVSLDGHDILSHWPGARSRGVTARVQLFAGVHDLSVGYEAPVPGDLRLLWSRAGEAPRELDERSLFVARPLPGQLAGLRLTTLLWPLAITAWLGLPLALALAVAAGARVSDRQRAALRVALPALVVLYAAALRFEALVGRYSWEGPRWALEAERAVRALHPASLRWKPALEGYSGDPYNYLVRAREMDGFYEPSVREPLFPFVTRVMLRLLGDRNLAVNAASAVFSTLAVLATYLLGAYAFSRGVGAGAALGVAMQRDAIWFGVEGFRDDAFMLFVLLSALALLRLRDRPTTLRAVLAGLAGGGAVLSRVTSVSFLIPAFALVALARGADVPRRRAILMAVGVMLAVAGPYLLSCALAYGDPFYAVNFHTKFYRSRSGMAFDTSMSWLDYLRTGFRPFHLLDTGLTGLTSYPFLNKWGGLEYVSPWVARVLSGAAVVGLVLFLWSAAGRLLLVVLLTSLLPYAFTWEVPGGAEWRFTMHALPFYLIAAWLALSCAAGLLKRARRREVAARLRERPRRLAALAGAAAAAAAIAWAGLCALSYLRARESLRAGEPAVIMAGARDRLFFGPGWSAPRRRGLVTVRRAEDHAAVVWIPLRAPADWRLTLRADPDPTAPEAALSVGLNGSPLASLPLSWDPNRIGSYDLLLPRQRLRPGRNRLELGPAGVVLWYLRLEPLSATESAR